MAGRQRPSTTGESLPALGRNISQSSQSSRGGRVITSNTTLTELDPARAPSSSTAPQLSMSASAPSLSLLRQQAAAISSGIERVCAKMHERPGLGPLLLLHEQEHAAHILKAVRPGGRKPKQEPPRLLLQPPFNKNALGALQRKSTVLSEIADEMSGYQHEVHLVEDEEDDDDQGGSYSRAQTAEAELPQLVGAGPGFFGGRPSTHGADGSVNSLHPYAQPVGRPGQLPRSRSSVSSMGPRSKPAKHARGTSAILMGSSSSSSLHAARAAASKSNALLDTRVDAYLMQYRLAQQRDTASVSIQSMWRGRKSRATVNEHRDDMRAANRSVFKAWRNVAQASRISRVRCMERAFFGWLKEQREAQGAIIHLAGLLSRAIGTSPAFGYWRIVLDKRKRRPRAKDCPSLLEALSRSITLSISRKILTLWRRLLKCAYCLFSLHAFLSFALTQPLSSVCVCRRLAVAREQAAIKIQAAAKPTNLWPSELLALALLMWSRIAKFRRCQRRGQPPPVYLRYVQQWHEWETKAIQKQLRVEVAQELHGPSLLRRLLRKWKTLPAVQQREWEMERAAEEMQLVMYGGTTIQRWKGLVEWRRSNRGFFKMLLSAWRHWASSHKHASAVAFAAASRHRLTCMAQYFEILQQHTAYRRRLNGSTTLQICFHTAGKMSGAIARKAAFTMQGSETHALAVQAFASWHHLIRGSNYLQRFKEQLKDQHAKALCEMVFVRWHIAARAEKENYTPSEKQKLLSQWSQANAAFGYPIDPAVTHEMHKKAGIVRVQDLANAAAAKAAEKTKAAMVAVKAAAAEAARLSAEADAAAVTLRQRTLRRTACRILYESVADGLLARMCRLKLMLAMGRRRSLRKALH